MLRKIIEIDSELCNGCGICVDACHEGAIGMINGKAVLLRDDYCDGLGDCLPTCPTGAIAFTEKDTLEFNAEEVKINMARKAAASATPQTHGGCPGSRSMAIKRSEASTPVLTAVSAKPESELRQWPVQIQLVPVNAPYFNGAKLLVAADCAAFAYGNFHQDFMKNKVTIIGCPKLDAVDYSEKLTAILKNNNIKSVTVARMEVPCCGGIEHAVKKAILDSGKMIPWQIVVISNDGQILED